MGKTPSRRDQTKPSSELNDVVALRAAEDLLHDEWTLQLLAELARGPRRFHELELALQGIGASVLSARLQSFESNGVLHREVLEGPEFGEIYQLTERGLRGVDVVVAAAAWVRTLFPGLEHRDL